MSDTTASKFNKKQQTFIMGMVQCRTTTEAATLAEISLVTANKFLHDKAINDEIKKLRQSVMERSLDRLQSALELSVNTLINLLEDIKCPKSIKLNAAKTILDSTLRIREQSLIIDRISALEEKLSEENKN